MIRKKVLGIGTSSATLLVQDTAVNGELRVLRRINVSGWPQPEIQAVQDLYNALYRDNLSGFVHVHAVLMQSPFLNVVTSYCTGGDLMSYLEDEQEDPLPEKQALLWMLVLAQSLHQLHTITKLPCYGPSLNRVYMDSELGTAGILNGLPVCAYVYFKAMADRQKDGISVEPDYPPEVLQSKEYHATLSDVWHLGRLGTQLLSAHAQLAGRSGVARQLLSQMMDPSLAKRLPLDGVITSLKSIVGDVKLRRAPEHKVAAAAAQQQQQPSSSSSNSGGNAAAKVSAPPSLDTRKVSAPVDSSSTSSPPDVTLTVPNRSVGNAANGGGDTHHGNRASPARRHHDAESIHASPNTSTTTTAAANQPRGQRTGTAQDSWHRKAEEQFAELQRMNASPPLQRHPSRPGSPRGGGGGSGFEQANRRPSPPALMIPVNPQQQQQHAHAAGQRRGSSAGRQPSSARGSGVLDSNTRALNEMFAEREAMAARQERMREETDWRRRRQALDERKASREHVQHQNNLRQIRADDGRQADIRRHLREWRERQTEELAHGYGDNVVVMANDNVTILAPRPAPPERLPPGYRDSAKDTSIGGGGESSDTGKGTGTKRGGGGGGSAAKKRISEDDFLPNHNAHVPVTILVPKHPPPPPAAQPPSRAPAKDGPGNRHASYQATEDQPTPSSLSTPDYVTPREARDTPEQHSRPPPPSSPPSTAPPHRAASPPSRDPYQRVGGAATGNSSHSPRPVEEEEEDQGPRGRVPTPQLRQHVQLRQQQQQQMRWGSRNGAHPQVPPIPLSPPPPPQPQQVYPDGSRHSGLANPTTTDTSTIATLEWTIDGVRSSIRTLLGNRALYGEAMMAVADFVSRGEEARMQPRQNDDFMIHLKSLIQDNRVFGAAAPLCVQLVALEGLYQTVRESGTVPRSAR